MSQLIFHHKNVSSKITIFNNVYSWKLTQISYKYNWEVICLWQVSHFPTCGLMKEKDNGKSMTRFRNLKMENKINDGNGTFLTR